MGGACPSAQKTADLARRAMDAAQLRSGLRHRAANEAAASECSSAFPTAMEAVGLGVDG